MNDAEAPSVVVNTIKNIVAEYLKANGYDDCGCYLPDLVACDECFSDCKPGYRKFYANNEDCGCSCEDGHYHLQADKVADKEYFISGGYLFKRTRRLTDAELKQIEAEGDRLKRDIEEQTRGMETAGNLKTRVD